jgi:16S rRNA (guanine966-N2)-methyltransferase
MRVIAGSARGTVLTAPARGTRPVSDRAREGLFSSLGDDVLDAKCLDLYAGSGALGIEALSRGAASCTFVDRARPASAAIRENLRRSHLAARGIVVTRDVGAFLRAGGGDDGPADIAFVDPPYEVAGAGLEGVLTALDARWVLPHRSTVVLTRGHKGLLPAVPVHWAARRHLRYGDSLVILYRP